MADSRKKYKPKNWTRVVNPLTSYIQMTLTGEALPLDNLDSSFLQSDALFTEWPESDAIIGNPPYQSKNKMQAEYGPDYLNRLREKYPGVPGRADYCVYWFRRAHDELKPGQRAGLVGTNTIRQNYSREGGLDYIIANGGTITDAVSAQVWSGEAVVHVSIVNWIKGKQAGLKTLSRQVGDDRDSPWEVERVDTINSSLSFDIDVSTAIALRANAEAGFCYQGQTHGHKGFILKLDEARSELNARPESFDVVRPFLIGTEMLGKKDSRPARAVIDFGSRGVLESRKYTKLFARIQSRVLPVRQEKANKEARRNSALLKRNPKARVNRHHAVFLDRWWQLSWPWPELMSEIDTLPRYVVCVRVTKRPIFEFVCHGVSPNDSLTVFPMADDYSFGILQSDTHWQSFIARCSTLKRDFRYTSDTVFDSFPWPQAPSEHTIAAVAQAARTLHTRRRELMAENGLSLRGLYRTIDQPGKHPLKDVHARLDAVVRRAYGMEDDENALSHLLALNRELADREEAKKSIGGPGLPKAIDPKSFISTDCISAPDPWNKKK